MKSKDHSLKSHSKSTAANSTSLLNDGKIFLFDEIDDKSTRIVYKQLCHLEKMVKPIEITICSSGGDVEAACAIIDKIVEISLKMPVTTIVAGRAHSAAAIILMAAPNRYAYKNSSIMFHPCYYGISDYHEQNRSYVEFTERTYPTLMRFVTEQAHMGKRQARNFIDKSKIGLWLTAEDAKSHKIIHGIIGEQIELS